jgi:hypothetical protein
MPSIRGRLVDAVGRPVAEAAVMIVESERPHEDIAALTGEDGRFELSGLAPGRYVILVNPPGAASQRVTVRLAERDEDLGLTTRED